ncbi:MAG: EAL domain-containing protein, partial [Chromatiales bacterium]|nr:EAL domain-containing protein [Chromatiales bacterium]
AYYDTLTGLPNRVLFHDRLSQALAQSKRHHSSFTLILADLDNFKTINDTLGHAAGDQLLIQVADRLKHAVREADTVARLGGDEFALVLMDINKPEEAATVASHILDSVSRPYDIHGLEIIAGASLGITFWPTDGNTLDELLKHADVAMYRAKSQGRNNFQFFTTDMAESVASTLRIESHLRHALEDGELSLYYQPQVDTNGAIVSAEALMRWHSRELGAIPPAQFIPIAERSGLIVPLGDFALKQACHQCQQWRQTLRPDFRVAVNLSAAQFRHKGLIDKVAATLEEANLPASALELEITESVVMEDVGRGQMMIDGLKKLGCKISIDDFGTGHSSLAYLTRFQVDVLKIDKSFVDGLGEDPEDTSVAEAIVHLAQILNLDVVAEGVETATQLGALKEITQNHHYLAQGYLFSPPIPPDQFAQRFPHFTAG